MLFSSRKIHSVFVFATAAGLVIADSNDWVNVDYVLSHSGTENTADALQSILRKANGLAKTGPWTITNKGGAKPPSGDVRDYLSWAPYHWPACDWCSHGTNHLGPNQGGNANNNNTGDADPNYGLPDASNPDDDSGDSGDPYERRALYMHRRMATRRRRLYSHGTSAAYWRRQPILNDASIPTLPPTMPPLATNPPDVGDLPTVPTGSSTVKTINGTPAPAQAPAKTNKCTPSPTKSMPPEATWTSCPYEVHDGKVNPDVRTLPDSPAAVTMSQAVLYNAIVFAAKNTRQNSQNAAKFIDTFFLAPDTGMNPNMNFGQQVRGPGKEHQMGTFTGILDMRAIVKVVNAIAILKAAGSPDWTTERDKTMTDWMRSYASWLESSAIGKETASKPNNHVSFYINQLAAAKMYLGDTQSAQVVLQDFFDHQFQDQIAASGEQPFEAVRTRPYHYRCFNLEAIITNAKLGDQLGMNFWTAKSRYGATIQTALDYLIGVDPKQEDIADIFPHVAAVAAAYGDPNGKYAAFLRKHSQDYTSQPFWFYDQSIALPNSPAAGHHKRNLGIAVNKMANTDEALSGDMGTMETMVMDVVNAAKAGDVVFVCPDAFRTAKQVELEDGVYASCKDLEPYYKIAVPVSP